MLLPSSSSSSWLSPSSFVIKESVIQWERQTCRVNNFKGVFSVKLGECMVLWGAQRVTLAYLRTRVGFLESCAQCRWLDAGTLAGRVRALAVANSSPSRDRLFWSPVDFRTVFVFLLVMVCRGYLPGLPCLPPPILRLLFLFSGIKLLMEND